MHMCQRKKHPNGANKRDNQHFLRVKLPSNLTKQDHKTVKAINARVKMMLRFLMYLTCCLVGFFDRFCVDISFSTRAMDDGYATSLGSDEDATFLTDKAFRARLGLSIMTRSGAN